MPDENKMNFDVFKKDFSKEPEDWEAADPILTVKLC